MDGGDRGRYSNLSTEEDACENAEAAIGEMREASRGLPREPSASLLPRSPPGPPGLEGTAAQEPASPSSPGALPSPGRRRRWWLAPAALVAVPTAAFGSIGAWRLLQGPASACGEPGACGRCELRPALPLWTWTCGECSLGFHEAHGECQANICTCRNGSAATDAKCRWEGEESCGGCDSGFHLAGRLCDANRCTCEGGRAMGPEGCREDGSELCRSCDGGFHLEGGVCERNRCTCDMGSPAVGKACDMDGAERCSRCDFGLHLVESFCQKNRCTCRHGSPLTGTGCSRDGAERCRACDPGFHLVARNFTCAWNFCTCRHGSALAGAGCLLDGSERCGSCDAGYHLASGLCAENLCDCRGGVAPRGVDCAADGSWRCSSCTDGFHLLGKHCDPLVHVYDGDHGGEADGGLQSDEYEAGFQGLLADLAERGHRAQPFAGRAEVDWATRRAGVLMVPELSGPLELDAAAREGLKSWIRRGGHLVVCGDYFGHNGRFLNAMFGWTLQGVLSYHRPVREEEEEEKKDEEGAEEEKCGIFCEGPKSLEWNPEVSCYAGTLLPSEAQAVYRDGDSVCVFTVERGSGRVTYLGFNWYNSTRQNWMQLLHLAVVGSGVAGGMG